MVRLACRPNDRTRFFFIAQLFFIIGSTSARLGLALSVEMGRLYDSPDFLVYFALKEESGCGVGNVHTLTTRPKLPRYAQSRSASPQSFGLGARLGFVAKFN